MNSKSECLLTYDELYTVAQYLYGLLDDIDTATDIAKSDNRLYRAIADNTQARKQAVVLHNDGYVIHFRPLPKSVTDKQ